MESRAGERTCPENQALAEAVAKLGPLKKQIADLASEEKKLVAKVKEHMTAANLSEIVAGGYKAKITSIANDVINEGLAMQILKHELRSEPALLQDIIKTKEFIDQEFLESAIYRRQVPADILATAIEHKAPTVRLSCSKVKL